jgi:putative FmdB family regulatory protein
MPIYEYRCPNCGIFETVQRITEPALKRCPTCKSKVDRIISNTSFVLKGTGWYATDYARSNSAKTSEKPEDKPKEGGDSKSAGSNGATASPSTESASSGSAGSVEKVTKSKSPD